MRIALDAMGGDHGPRPVVEGAIQAVQRFRGVDVVLVGPETQLRRLLATAKFDNNDRITVHDAPDVIEMHEKPRQTLRRKESSIFRSVELVKNGDADAVISPGNTGAYLAHCLFGLRPLPTIQKPAIATYLPTWTGQRAVILDSGANVDCKPHQIVRFAAMGAALSKVILDVENPRVALLSNGEEETKGDEITVATNKLLKQTDLNFVGNCEGNHLLSGDYDVIAADGFPGNIALKTAEGTASMAFKILKREIKGGLMSSIGGLLIRNAGKRVKKLMDYEETGGAPLLGLNGVAIVCHGRSGKRAYFNAIRVAAEAVKLDLVRHIKEDLQHVQEIIGTDDENGS